MKTKNTISILFVFVMGFSPLAGEGFPEKEQVRIGVFGFEATQTVGTELAEELTAIFRHELSRSGALAVEDKPEFREMQEAGMVRVLSRRRGAVLFPHRLATDKALLGRIDLQNERHVVRGVLVDMNAMCVQITEKITLGRGADLVTLKRRVKGYATEMAEYIRNEAGKPVVCEDPVLTYGTIPSSFGIPGVDSEPERALPEDQKSAAERGAAGETKAQAAVETKTEAETRSEAVAAVRRSALNAPLDKRNLRPVKDRFPYAESHSRMSAAGLSMVLPGLGQLYAGRTFRGLAYLAGGAALGANAANMVTQSVALQARTYAYVTLALEGGANTPFLQWHLADKALSEKARAVRRADESLGLLAGFWILNIADAALMDTTTPEGEGLIAFSPFGPDTLEPGLFAKISVRY